MIIKSEKKLVPVSVSTISRASQVAKRKMTSLSKFVEDAVNHAVRVEEELGLGLEDAYSLLRAVKTLRVLGGVFIPQPVLECLVDGECGVSRERLLEKWFESGKLYGVYLRDSTSRSEVLGAFLRILRWDFSEVRVDNEGSSCRVRCIATSITSEETEYIARFLEGLISGLACTVTRVECIKGLVAVEFKC